MTEDVLRDEVATLKRMVGEMQQSQADVHFGSFWPKWGPTIVVMISIVAGAVTFSTNLDKRLALQEQAYTRMQVDIQKLSLQVEILANQVHDRARVDR